MEGVFGTRGKPCSLHASNASILCSCVTHLRLNAERWILLLVYTHIRHCSCVLSHLALILCLCLVPTAVAVPLTLNWLLAGQTSTACAIANNGKLAAIKADRIAQHAGFRLNAIAVFDCCAEGQDSRMYIQSTPFN